ncbi:MAG: GNAT family N-acetyltransferase [Dysgonamonadaceae bacterium]|jgi:GNAT superfamily N-acetyltransferase|nr:GNAT family N-acetyltransferase [Dysgonamonadaceae bacterium]
MDDFRVVFGRKVYKPALRQMWEQCFLEDDDDFLDFYFGEMFRCRGTLVGLSGGIPVTSLQMFPYRLHTQVGSFPVVYLCGVMTREEFRGRGYCGALLRRSIEVIRGRGFGYILLIPQDMELFDFYEKFGFIACDEGKSEAVLEVDSLSRRILPDYLFNGIIFGWPGMIMRVGEGLPEVLSLHVIVSDGRR